MSTSFFDFYDSIKIPRLEGETPSGSGQIIFNDEIRGSTGDGSTSFRPTTTGANVQTFIANGTWTKPAGATVVNILMIGGGGGGGSGASRGSNGAAYGGSGGAGGFMVRNAYALASAVESTVTVTVGAGGAGGLDGTGYGNGLFGGTGGTSSFGSYFGARGGNPGAGGTTTSQGVITPATVSIASDLPGGYGSGNTTSTTYGFFPSSGGNGRGLPSGNTSAGPGVDAPNVGSYILGTPLSGGTGAQLNVAAAGSPGADARYTIYPGTGASGGGGGAGGNNTLSPAWNAGRGGNYGGGGGGGGGPRVSSGNSVAGTGGAGGSGIVVVISW